ncbi:hypothetical protein ACFFX0_07585 [Citricoccus parietis]|uniref:Uncharacterized protein n=1 Tax=Citricoccus parietis TaxID=592307 RepID=A0ABV5FX98_9MICC
MVPRGERQDLLGCPFRQVRLGVGRQAAAERDHAHDHRRRHGRDPLAALLGCHGRSALGNSSSRQRYAGPGPVARGPGLRTAA